MFRIQKKKMSGCKIFPKKIKKLFENSKKVKLIKNRQRESKGIS